MDFMGTILKGIVGVFSLMVLVYLLATYGGAVSDNAIPLFLIPIGIAMFLANEPTRKGLAAVGLSGMAVILIAGSTTIGWVLLLTIPPPYRVYCRYKVIQGMGCERW
jgi:TctA family transporter